MFIMSENSLNPTVSVTHPHLTYRHCLYKEILPATIFLIFVIQRPPLLPDAFVCRLMELFDFIDHILHILELSFLYLFFLLRQADQLIRVILYTLLLVGKYAMHATIVWQF